MSIWEILLIGVALSMDAFAAGMTDGMTEPHMGWKKTLLIAGVFGFMQFAMPVAGYFFGGIFTALVERIAPVLSFVLLAFVGGKSVVEFFLERKKKEPAACRPARLSEVVVQGVATSLDALAVGVTFLAVETSDGLPMSVIWCSVLIGAVTLFLSLCAILIGKKLGDRFADKAKLAGGLVLIAIGLKILIEGLV